MQANIIIEEDSDIFTYTLDGGATWSDDVEWDDLPANIRELWNGVISHWPDAGKVWVGKLENTVDKDVKARLTRVLYRFLNFFPRRCRKMGFCCEYVYPYGFVAQGGCPIHD
jgi:hypothetical protein